MKDALGMHPFTLFIREEKGKMVIAKHNIYDLKMDVYVRVVGRLRYYLLFFGLLSKLDCFINKTL